MDDDIFQGDAGAPAIIEVGHGPIQKRGCAQIFIEPFLAQQVSFCL
jgi:hypothetical protein